MKIKNTVLANLMAKLGKVKAELVIDDANGVSLTFPDISEISELAVGVATSAPDGTYVIADGDNTITIVVLSGVIESVEVSEPGDEVSAEVAAVLEAVVEKTNTQTAEITALKADLAALKVALKHDDGKGGKGAAAAAGKTKPSFKVI